MRVVVSEFDSHQQNKSIHRQNVLQIQPAKLHTEHTQILINLKDDFILFPLPFKVWSLYRIYERDGN